MYYASRTILNRAIQSKTGRLHNSGGRSLANFTIERIYWDTAAQQVFSSGSRIDLYLFLRGGAVFRCGSANLPANAETLVIFKAGEVGTLQFSGAHAPLEVLRVQLSPAALRALSDETTDLAKAFDIVPFRQIAVRPDNEIYMLLKNLARKLYALPAERDHFGAAIFENGILQMFVVLVLRACIQAERHKAQVSRHHLMLDEVFLYIQTHLDEEITLQQLEDHFFVSHEHISREFKRQTGQTVHAYIVKAKLDRCCRLIEQGYPITEVYKMAGFGGYNNFFRAFKKEYGMTPRAYFRATQAGAQG